MSDYNENNQGGYDPQSSSQSFGQGTGGAPIPPNSYYHYQGAGPGGAAGTNATAPVNPASPYAQSAGAHNAQAYAAKQDPKPKKNHSGAKTFGIAFAGAALACVLVLGGTSIVNTVTSGSPSGSTTVLGGTSSASTSGSADENATLAESVSQKCLPSVVAIDVYTNQQSGYYGYSTQNSLTETSLGSGVVLSSDGYIVTNYHVIEGADALKVTIEGEEYDADIIGSDPSSDIAVIKAKNASGLTAMELGDSDDLTVGEWVMSIGSPFGLEQSVATGIVSATNRSQIMDNSSNSNQYGQQQSSTTTVYTNMIQTDAAINPGNSGGALFDSYGNVIGIVYAKSSSVSIEGIGYAIPVNNIKDLVAQMINDPDSVKDQTKGSQIMLGITIRDITEDMSKQYSMPVGVYITEVSSMSAAERAGLQKGDIITEFAGETVTSADDLNAIKAKQTSGDTVSVKIDRNGKEMTLDLVIPQPTEVDTASNK